MKKLIKILAFSFILAMTMSSFALAAAGEPQEFRIELSPGYNPNFTVTNVKDSSINDYSSGDTSYDVRITAEKPAKMVCDFIFESITIEKDGVVYSNENGQPVSSVVNEQNKNIVPDGPVMPAHYDQGYTLQFNEPGIYTITINHVGYHMTVILTVTEKQGVVLPDEVSAVPSSSKVLVNGFSVSFDAYNINGNNYFKLRDIAKVVSGTEKQFEVLWDNDKKAINLISAQPYTVVGGELSTGAKMAQKATLNKSVIYKDRHVVSLTAYTINGNNFFKLRDLAQAFNIGVTWDGSTKTIGIDTSVDYMN